MKIYEEILETLHLSEHPEGGYFRQTYKSELIVQPLKMPIKEPPPHTSTISYPRERSVDFIKSNMMKFGTCIVEKE